MANNLEFPAGVFDPVPNPAALPTNLVTVGIYIATSIITSLSWPTPPVVAMSGSTYVPYAFCGALAAIFLFGLGTICVGWLVADYPARYATLGRIVMRTSQVVLVFAVALREEVASASKSTPAKADGK